MKIFLYYLGCLGIGFVLGIGTIVIIFTIRIFITDLIDKNKKKSLNVIYRYGENCILLSPSVFSSGTRKLFESIKKLQLEAWQKDIVIPLFNIELVTDFQDFNLEIRIETNEIFKDKIDIAQTDEEKNDFIISRIKEYFFNKEKSKGV